MLNCSPCARHAPRAAAPNGASYIYVSFCALSLALGAIIYSLMSNLTQLNRLNTSNQPKEESAWAHGSSMHTFCMHVRCVSVANV